MATKTETAIDFIASHGAARSPEISKACGSPENAVPSLLSPYVRGGVLVSCRIDQPGKQNCCEYRLATGVTAKNWRDFKVGIYKESAIPNAPPKRATPPAPVPAVQTQVTDKNSVSTRGGAASPLPTGRAVTAKPTPKAHRNSASGAGGHVPIKPPKDAPRFGYFDDGSVEIIDCGIVTVLDAASARRLADFLMNCLIYAEVNA